LQLADPLLVPLQWARLHFLPRLGMGGRVPAAGVWLVLPFSRHSQHQHQHPLLLRCRWGRGDVHLLLVGTPSVPRCTALLPRLQLQPLPQRQQRRMRRRMQQQPTQPLPRPLQPRRHLPTLRALRHSHPCDSVRVNRRECQCQQPIKSGSRRCQVIRRERVANASNWWKLITTQTGVLVGAHGVANHNTRAPTTTMSLGRQRQSGTHWQTPPRLTRVQRVREAHRPTSR
jgi:hypothetical protein